MPQSNRSYSSRKLPVRFSTAPSTVTAASSTSGPMPSPGYNATRWVFIDGDHYQSSAGLRGGEQHRTASGDHDRVFVMRGQAAILRLDRPSVPILDHRARSRADDRLDREDQSFGEHLTL